MPRTSNPPKESVAPTMSPQQAIPLIRRQIERLDELLALNFRDPRIQAWQSTTINLLNAAYGLPNGTMHPNTVAVHRNGPSTFFSIGDPDADQSVFQDKLRATRALLHAYIEQLETLAPPAAQAAPAQYRFHAEIERVSGDLHRDGHYKQAALEAYIRVIDEVKTKSRLGLDGDPLMNQAFGCDKQTPVIRFNSLQSDAERDEQKGIMFLFKGIVSLRNSKAHSNTLFNDPGRAHEYLALASLLMRVLEIATINPP